MTRAVIAVELDLGITEGLGYVADYRGAELAAEIRRLVTKSLGHLNPEVSVLDTGARS